MEYGGRQVKWHAVEYEAGGGVGGRGRYALATSYLVQRTPGEGKKILYGRWLRKVKTTGVEARRGRVDAAGVEYGGGGGGYSRQWEEYGGTRRTAGDTAGSEHGGLRVIRQG